MDPKGIPNAGQAMIGGDVLDAGDKFQPTEQWLTELKESLSLETVTRHASSTTFSSSCGQNRC
jgi:hypothetical protein